MKQATFIAILLWVILLVFSIIPIISTPLANITLLEILLPIVWYKLIKFSCAFYEYLEKIGR